MPRTPGNRRRPQLADLHRLPGATRLPAAAAARLPVAPKLLAPWRRHEPDLTGWTGPELTAYLSMDRPGQLVPPRRAGHAAVRALNALSGRLPTEAVLLGRAIADAAPPVGTAIAPALHDILERYLPASIEAYEVSAGGTTRTTRSSVGVRAELLLIEQLRVLYDGTGLVLAAQADHDDLDLQIQADFLRDRFSALESNPLDVPPDTPGAGGTRRSGARARRETVLEPEPAVEAGDDVAAAPSGLTSASALSRHTLRVDRDPVRLFPPKGATVSRIEVRLALPRGLPVTLGVTTELRSGAIRFLSKRVSGWASGRRRDRGFRAAQVDVGIDVDLTDVRRFLVHVTSPRSGEPMEVAAFVTASTGAGAALTTLLARRSTALTTVVASGFDTRDGLLIRNETAFYPHLRAACSAYGFADVTWLSDDTPAV